MYFKSTTALVVAVLVISIVCGVQSVDPYSPAAYVPIMKQTNGIDFTAQACVIGAGFSGVGSVETLVKEGNMQNWLLIEAENRIGGRTKTATVGAGANTYNVEEHGQWVQGDLRNPILKMGSEIPASLGGPLRGGNSKWGEYDYYDNNGVKVGYNQGSSMGRAMINLYAAQDCVWHEIVPLIINGSLVDMSLRDCYALCGFAPNTAEEYAAEAGLVAVEWGELSDITSCVNSGQWVAYSFYGDDARNGTANFVNDQRGVQIVAKWALIRNGVQLNDTRIHYNTKISNVNTDTNVITAIRNGNTVKYQCDTIINTISIGALQASLRKNANLVTPLPPLAVQASIHKYHMAFFRKLFLQYKTKFWGDKAHFLITPKNRGLAFANWNSVDYPNFYPGSRILLSSQNGPDSNKYSNMDPISFLKEATQQLVAVFGSAAAFENLELNGWYIGNDTYDPSLDGSYSNRPATLSEVEFRAMWAPVKGHYFPSGEAACDFLNGYITGAYLQGITAARRALINLGLPTAGPAEDNECYRPPAGWVA